MTAELERIQAAVITLSAQATPLDPLTEENLADLNLAGRLLAYIVEQLLAYAPAEVNPVVLERKNGPLGMLQVAYLEAGSRFLEGPANGLSR